MFDILDMMDTMTRLHVEYVRHDGSAGNCDWTWDMGNVRNIAKGTTG